MIIRKPNIAIYHLSVADQALVLNLDHSQFLNSESVSLTVHNIIDSNEHAGSVG